MVATMQGMSRREEDARLSKHWQLKEATYSRSVRCSKDLTLWTGEKSFEKVTYVNSAWDTQHDKSAMQKVWN